MITPTQEQSDIVQAFRQGKTLTIEAGAGTGKSSTLRMCAETDPNKLGIYVAYNRALADDAARSFPRNTICKTAHALAFGAVGKRYSARLGGPRIPVWATIRELEIPQETDLSSMLVLPDEHLARVVMDGVAAFCNSALDKPDRSCIGYVPPLTFEQMEVLKGIAVPFLLRAWEDLSKVDGNLRFTHDCYLKLWQLSRPVVESDFLLLDEGQDLSPVMVDVFERQQGVQRALVGDSAQAIYAWRGAVDAMQTFDSDLRLRLSKSFRFGAPIAAEANKWLKLLRAPGMLTGNELVQSAIWDPDDPMVPQEMPPSVARQAVLCRTNAEAVGQAMDLMAKGRRVAVVGGGEAVRAMAQAALALKAGRKTSHPELFLFKSWRELQEYVEGNHSGGADLKVLVRLVEMYGAERLLKALDGLVDEQEADIVVSTAHKAKGREWAHVRIAGDFPSPAFTEDDRKRGKQDSVAEQDLKLAYVATTRAKNVLDRGGLAWIDRWLAKVGLA